MEALNGGWVPVRNSATLTASQYYLVVLDIPRKNRRFNYK